MDTRIDLATALSDFANLAATEKAVSRFKTNWPGFLPEHPENMSFKIKFQNESGEESPSDIPENLHWVVWLTATVRALWVGNTPPAAIQILESILLTGKMVAVNLTPFVQQFLSPSATAPLPGIIGVDWKRRTIVYRPQTTLQAALYYLLQHSDKSKVCGNPDCPAPYFIAKRGNKKYCGDDCEAEARIKAKSRWWDEHGEEWRKARNPKNPKRKKRS